MSGFLERMARASSVRAAAIRGEFPEAELTRPVVPLRLAGFDLIAEIKPRSPAEGRLTAGDANLDLDNIAGRAAAYARAGAAAISVLTEPSEFGGALAHLERVVAAVDGAASVMRKDFLVDPRQVSEARAAGASGVLLIAALQDDTRLTALLDRAFGLGMFVLLECFDGADLARAAALLDDARYAAPARENELLVGVNARDLRTLAVDPARLRVLAPLLPAGAAAVAESGLHDANDAREAAASGYRAALVGTALMRAPDPGALVESMLEAGRRAAGARTAGEARERET